ncbi:MAG: hypothetical protein ACKOU7_09910 [Ferruginibacter sp.]
MNQKKLAAEGPALGTNYDCCQIGDISRVEGNYPLMMNLLQPVYVIRAFISLP